MCAVYGNSLIVNWTCSQLLDPVLSLPRSTLGKADQVVRLRKCTSTLVCVRSYLWSYRPFSESKHMVIGCNNISVIISVWANSNPSGNNICHTTLWQHSLPDTIVTGPLISLNFCLVKFRIRHRIKVLFPTFGGPITTTTIGGGSSGVRSTTGIWCLFVFRSWVLFVYKNKTKQSVYFQNTKDHFKYRWYTEQTIQGYN